MRYVPSCEQIAQPQGGGEWEENVRRYVDLVKNGQQVIKAVSQKYETDFNFDCGVVGLTKLLQKRKYIYMDGTWLLEGERDMVDKVDISRP